LSSMLFKDDIYDLKVVERVVVTDGFDERAVVKKKDLRFVSLKNFLLKKKLLKKGEAELVK